MTSEQPQTLRLFQRGSRRFAVSEENVATVADWREPVPLPNAPDSILGVVSIHGRMLTVLDLASFPQSEPAANGLPNAIIALRGDEQLALAVDSASDTIDSSAVMAVSKPDDSPKFVRAVFAHDGSEINLVNIRELFAYAMQGRERRQRRF